MLAAVLACSTLAPLAPAVAELPGYVAEFYGWHPDSRDFAYAIVEHRRDKPPRSRYYMKRTRDAKQVATGKTFGGSVRMRAHEQGYVRKPLKGQRLSPFVQAFVVGPGRTLRIVLELRGDKLGYTAWLDRAEAPTKPKRLIGGYFKEVWTEFDATVYLSPDGQWAAVVLKMQTPYKQQAWVEGLRVGTGR